MTLHLHLPARPLLHPLLFLLVPLLLLARAASGEQTYISILPRVLVLQPGKHSQVRVEVTCRQLPAVQPVLPQRLKLTRKGRESSTVGKEDILAVIDQDGTVTTEGSYGYRASGRLSEALVLVMPEAGCEEGRYTYACTSQVTGRNHTSSAQLVVVVKPPALKLLASPAKPTYSPSETVTLTCVADSGADTGVGTPEGRSVWIWEYNDVGPWTQIHTGVQRARAEFDKDGCFANSPSSSVRVRVGDIDTCHRVYRCYLRYGYRQPADQAPEVVISKSQGCEVERPGEKGADPAVAIILTLAALMLLVYLTGFLFACLRRHRARQKVKTEQMIRLKILASMSPEKRNKLLEERFKKHSDKRASAPTTPFTAPLKIQPLVRLDSKERLANLREQHRQQRRRGAAEAARVDEEMTRRRGSAASTESERVDSEVSSAVESQV